MGAKTTACVCEDDGNTNLRCSKECKNGGDLCNKNKCIPKPKPKKKSKKKSLKKSRGGSRKLNFKLENINLKNRNQKNKAIEIALVYGNPNKIERDQKNNIVKVSWKNIDGLDEIVVMGEELRKLHPHPAPVFVIAKKLLYVPDHLLGPLKYASETINIEQLDTTKKINKHYEKTGEKLKAMVSGSCASIIISAITLKFVEDMVRKYKTKKSLDKQHVKCSDNLFKEFRGEYDTRVDAYLKGKGIIPTIPWFKNRVEKQFAKHKFI